MADVPAKTDNKTGAREGDAQAFNRFAWMKGWLYDGLHYTTVAVLTVLFDHMGDDGRAWPSVGRICDTLDLSDSCVRGHLNKAAKAGWIEKVNRGHSSNVYVATFGKPSATQEADTSANQKADTTATSVTDGAIRHEGGGLSASCVADTSATQEATEQSIRTDQRKKKGEAARESYWQTEFNLEPVSPSERVDPKLEFESMWPKHTRFRVRWSNADTAAAVVDTCKHFTRDQIKEAIKAASEPGINDRLRYLYRTLQNSLTQKPTPKPRPRKADPTASRSFRQTDYSQLDVEMKEI